MDVFLFISDRDKFFNLLTKRQKTLYSEPSTSKSPRVLDEDDPETASEKNDFSSEDDFCDKDYAPEQQEEESASSSNGSPEEDSDSSRRRKTGKEDSQEKKIVRNKRRRELYAEKKMKSLDAAKREKKKLRKPSTEDRRHKIKYWKKKHYNTAQLETETLQTLQKGHPSTNKYLPDKCIEKANISIIRKTFPVLNLLMLELEAKAIINSAKHSTTEDSGTSSDDVEETSKRSKQKRGSAGASPCLFNLCTCEVLNIKRHYTELHKLDNRNAGRLSQISKDIKNFKEKSYSNEEIQGLISSGVISEYINKLQAISQSSSSVENEEDLQTLCNLMSLFTSMSAALQTKNLKGMRNLSKQLQVSSGTLEDTPRLKGVLD